MLSGCLSLEKQTWSRRGEVEGKEILFLILYTFEVRKKTFKNYHFYINLIFLMQNTTDLNGLTHLHELFFKHQ